LTCTGNADDGFFDHDVEGTIDWPSRRSRNPDDTVEHYGYASDGRYIKVVTDNSERYVVTVIDVHKRRRERWQQRHRNSRDRS